MFKNSKRRERRGMLRTEPMPLRVTSRKHGCLILLNIFTEFQVEKVSTREKASIETFTKSKHLKLLRNIEHTENLTF